jgi:hypothetical protein
MGYQLEGNGRADQGADPPGRVHRFDDSRFAA